MSIFFPADDSVMALVRKVMKDNHEELIRANVDIGVTFALSAKENQPALKEHGQPTFGYTKIVAPKDRVRKSIDVELWLDGDEWGTDNAEARYAKVDHLLQRVEVKKPKPKKPKKGKKAVHGSDEENQQHEESEFVLDAGGKAKLQMRKPDLFVPGGYRGVIERNGKYAPEVMILDNARRLADAAVKVFDDEEAENERARQEEREAEPVVDGPPTHNLDEAATAPPADPEGDELDRLLADPAAA